MLMDYIALTLADKLLINQFLFTLHSSFSNMTIPLKYMLKSCCGHIHSQRWVDYSDLIACILVHIPLCLQTVAHE